VIADRVKELSTTTGTGAFALTGAVTGFEGFNTAFGVGPAFDYCIESIDDTIGAPNGSWEIGTGHLSGATTLVRATVRQSSNADALVAFAAGTKNVFCTLPASVVIALQAAVDAKVAKSGDTMSGNLTINKSNPIITLNAGAAGEACSLIGAKGSSISFRWMVIPGTAEAESGGNTGSNFQIIRCNDSSGIIDAPLTIDRASGNVGIGTTAAPGAKLDVSGGVKAASVTAIDNYSYFGGNIAERPAVGLTLAVGQNYSGFLAEVGFWNTYVGGAQSFVFKQLTGATAHNDLLALSPAGDLLITGTATKPGGGAWTATSDARIKDVLGDYTHGLAQVMQLLPVRYTFKGNYSKQATGPLPHQQLAEEQREFVGLIAQQAEVPMPEMVTTEVGFIDGKPVADLRVLDTTALVFALVNACKELAARVAALEGAA